MKSSGRVLPGRNPASRVKASCKQSMSKKKTTFSPVRPNHRSSSPLHSKQLFEQCDQRLAAADRQPVYAESWPSTEHGYSPASSTASSDSETPNPKSARAGKSTVSPQPGDQQESVLAKYIDRFRHGQPQSREERQRIPSPSGEKQLPFWWTSPTLLPHSSTPVKTTDGIQSLKDDHEPAICSPAGQRHHDSSLSLCRGSLSMLSDTTQGEFDDAEMQQLQDKASRLLLRGECTLSDGCVPVSSEGLECSDFSSSITVDEPVRRPLIPSLIRPTEPPTRREDDILFQWRLRRKLEQARESPQSVQHSSLHGLTFNWQAPGLNRPSSSVHTYKQHQSSQPPEVPQNETHPHITATKPQTKDTHISCPPASDTPSLSAFVVSGSSVPQPQAIPHVPAHMHLLCDVLPCPIRSSHVLHTQQHISESINETHGNSVNTFTDEPLREHMQSSKAAASAAKERAGLIHHERSERNKRDAAQTRESDKNKKTVPSSRKQKKSPRSTEGPDPANSSSSHRVPKKVTSLAEQQQQERSQRFSNKSYTGTAAPPPPSSPIQSALEQAVSEVLFPTVDSSSAQRSHISLASPCTASAPPKSSGPPCNTQNSIEVISQLLQEAEDSDERDFEDDPLLQVLRKQRKWVKEQISEVNSKLNEFLDEQQVT